MRPQTGMGQSKYSPSPPNTSVILL